MNGVSDFMKFHIRFKIVPLFGMGGLDSKCGYRKGWGFLNRVVEYFRLPIQETQPASPKAEAPPVQEKIAQAAEGAS